MSDASKRPRAARSKSPRASAAERVSVDAVPAAEPAAPVVSAATGRVHIPTASEIAAPKSAAPPSQPQPPPVQPLKQPDRSPITDFVDATVAGYNRVDAGIGANVDAFQNQLFSAGERDADVPKSPRGRPRGSTSAGSKQQSNVAASNLGTDDGAAFSTSCRVYRGYRERYREKIPFDWLDDDQLLRQSHEFILTQIAVLRGLVNSQAGEPRVKQAIFSIAELLTAISVMVDSPNLILGGPGRPLKFDELIALKMSKGDFDEDVAQLVIEYPNMFSMSPEWRLALSLAQTAMVVHSTNKQPQAPQTSAQKQRTPSQAGI